MKTKFLKFLVVFVPFTLFLFVTQYFIIETLKETRYFFYSTASIYIFHFFATFLIYIFVLFIHKNYENKAGFAFITCGLLKMMAAVVFLIPLIQNKQINALNDVIAFFIPYFFFLVLETVFVVKILLK
ncbi:MAG: hypothetical protein ACWIPJ_01825 [Polaribacter sp.]